MKINQRFLEEIISGISPELRVRIRKTLKGKEIYEIMFREIILEKFSKDIDYDFVSIVKRIKNSLILLRAPSLIFKKDIDKIWKTKKE